MGKNANCVHQKLMVSISFSCKALSMYWTHLLIFHDVCSIFQPTNASQNFQLEKLKKRLFLSTYISSSFISAFIQTQFWRNSKTAFCPVNLQSSFLLGYYEFQFLKQYCCVTKRHGCTSCMQG